MNLLRMRRSSTYLATLALGLLGATGPLFASPFQNGSFEADNPLKASPDFASTPTGWVKTDPTGSGLFLESYSTFSLPTLNADGVTAYGFGGNGDLTGTLAQTFDTVSGTQYLVAFQYVVQQNTTHESFQVDLTNGGTLASTQFLHFNNTAWAFSSLTFTATGPQTTLTFTDLSGAQDPAEHVGVNWALDGVSVTAQGGPVGTPEPATFALAVCGCLAGLAWRRYTQSSQK